MLIRIDILFFFFVRDISLAFRKETLGKLCARSAYCCVKNTPYGTNVSDRSIVILLGQTRTPFQLKIRFVGILAPETIPICLAQKENQLSQPLSWL